MSKENKFWSPSFMAEFKKWIDDKETDGNHIDKGSVVNTNLKLKTLVERMDCIKMLNDSVIDIAKGFIKNGGVVKETNGDNVIVKTKKGTFIISKQDLFLV